VRVYTGSCGGLLDCPVNSTCQVIEEEYRCVCDEGYTGANCTEGGHQFNLNIRPESINRTFKGKLWIQIIIL